MNIAIRCDAGCEIGIGHFMRCLTLALALKTRGAQITFFSRNLPKALIEILSEHKIQLNCLALPKKPSSDCDLDHSAWLGLSQQEDAEIFSDALGDADFDWLIVDHYALDFRWESKLRKHSIKILAIDDLADRRHDCDILLDQNLYSDMEIRYIGLIPSDAIVLLGPKYAILRDEFKFAREGTNPRLGDVKTILISFGGVDAKNFTGAVLESLEGIVLGNIKVDVLLGSSHPFLSEIQKICDARGYKCSIQTSEVSKHMASADLSIGAGGITLWERCCMGLPTFAISASENQSRQISDAASYGLVYSPSPDLPSIEFFRSHIRTLLNDPALIYQMSCLGMNFVDGYGANRVVDTLMAITINVRRVNNKDSKKIHRWRNHKIIREASRNPMEISIEAHQKWFEKVLKSKNQILLIGEFQGDDLGVVRFDKEGVYAEVSIYTVPDRIHKGLGLSLLISAENWLKRNYSDIDFLKAIVLEGNENSIKMFSRAGYSFDGSFFSKRLSEYGGVIENRRQIYS